MAQKKLLKEVKSAINEYKKDPSLLEVKAYKYLQEELPLRGMDDKTKLQFYARMIDAIEERALTGKYSFYKHFNIFRKDIPDNILKEDIEGVMSDIFRPSVSDYKWSFGKDYLTEKQQPVRSGEKSLSQQINYEAINESMVMHDSWWNMKKQVRINKAGIVKWTNSPFVEIGAQLSPEDMGKLTDLGFSLIPCQ